MLESLRPFPTVSKAVPESSQISYSVGNYPTDPNVLYAVISIAVGCVGRVVAQNNPLDIKPHKLTVIQSEAKDLSPI